MSILKTFAAGLCLTASAFALVPGAEAAGKRINALVMLQDADPETMSHETPIFRRVLPNLQETLSSNGIQVYDESIEKMYFQRPEGKSRSDIELMTIARAINQTQPLDVIVIFSIDVSAQKDVIEPSIVRPKVRMRARVLNIRSAQIDASFEVDKSNLPPLPNPCDDVCLMDEVSHDAQFIAADLGHALVVKLANFNGGGLRESKAERGEVVIDTKGPSTVAPQRQGDRIAKAKCEGLSGEYKIQLADFEPDELLEVERNMRQFACFEELRPVEAGSTYAVYSYRTSADVARVDRNLRLMLNYLEIKGEVQYDGVSFSIKKIQTRN